RAALAERDGPTHVAGQHRCVAPDAETLEIETCRLARLEGNFEQVAAGGAGIDRLRQRVASVARDAALDHPRTSTTAAGGPDAATKVSDPTPAAAKASRIADAMPPASRAESVMAAVAGPAPLMMQPYAPALRAAAHAAAKPGRIGVRAASKIEPSIVAPHCARSPRATDKATKAARAQPRE